MVGEPKPQNKEMNKRIITIIGMVLLINLVGAIDIYAGDSYSFELDEPYLYYKITGNQTEVDLDVQQNETNITINFGKYMEDTFTITFYNEKDEPIEGVGGNGGGGGYCYRGWTTTEWSDCINNLQTRNITRDRYGKCYQTVQTEPAKVQECTIKNDKDDSKPIISPDEKETNYEKIFIIIGAIILVIIILWVIFKNREDDIIE